MNGMTASENLTVPAAYRDEVVTLSCTARTAVPAHVDLRRGTGDGVVRRLPTGRLYVGIRAGRVTFATADGTGQVGVTLLGAKEAAGLTVGDPWPRSGPHPHRGRILDGLAAAVRGLVRVLTFPFAYPRAIRSSGERNEAVANVVSWCEREIPNIHVLYNAQHGAEHAVGGQLPAWHRKGLFGVPSWDDEVTEAGVPSRTDTADAQSVG